MRVNEHLEALMKGHIVRCHYDNITNTYRVVAKYKDYVAELQMRLDGILVRATLYRGNVEVLHFERDLALCGNGRKIALVDPEDYERKIYGLPAFLYVIKFRWLQYLATKKLPLLANPFSDC